MNRQSSTRNIKIPIPIHSKLKAFAAIADRKLQEVVEEALTDYLNRSEKAASREVIELKK